MSALFRDLRYACLSLARQPSWTLAAVVCLAIGVGPNTAAFSIVNGLVLRPLPFQDADQLVMVAIQEPQGMNTRPFSWTEYLEIAPDLATLAEVAVRTFAPVALASDSESGMVEAELSSANYFELLRLRPIAGRFFRADADRPGGTPEAVISHALWQRRFNGDPSIVGRPMRVNGVPITICGIAPAGFVGVTRIIAADLWLPATMHKVLAGQADTTPQFGAVARLTPGTARNQLRAKLDVTLAARARDGQRPATGVAVQAAGFGVPPAARMTVLSASVMLFGVIALVTGVAIANVASLTLARATDRRREIGVRVALGAGTAQIVRQMLVESVLLALLGSAVGFLLVTWITQGLAALVPDSGQPSYIAFAIDVTPDVRVLIYAAVAAIVVAALFGLAPARLAARTDVVEALRGSAGAGRRPATVRALSAVVVGQIAVSTTLLVGAGLLVRTYLNTLAVDPGIQTKNVLAVSLDLNQVALSEADGRRFFQEVTRRLAAVPGVERTSLTRERPLTFSGRDAPVWIDGAVAGAAERHDAGAAVVTRDYFALLGIDLLHGEGFTDADHGRPPIAIVNETMARRLWPDGSPLGRTFRLKQNEGASIQVIGVVRDVKYRSLTEAPRAVFYRPFSQEYAPRMSVLIRSHANVTSLLQTIEREIRASHPDLAVVDAVTLDEQKATAIATRRQSAVLLIAVCGLGLLLSSVGLYGVTWYGVRRRARELGIRIALGAATQDVLTMVVRQALRLTFIGVGIGLLMSLGAMRLLGSLLYGVRTYDPATMLVAAGVLVIVTLTAVYVPARWATRVNPIVVLRED